MHCSYTYIKVVFIGFAVFVADLISKLLVSLYIPLVSYSPLKYPYGGLGVFKDFLGVEFSINHQTNKGAAWGVFSDFQIYLLILRIFLIVGMVIYVAYYNKKKAWNIPLVLIIAGASGNVLDYFFYGHVVDMFHFVLWGYDYPIFNVADASIFFGIGWLLLLSWCDKTVIKHEI